MRTILLVIVAVLCMFAIREITPPYPVCGDAEQSTVDSLTVLLDSCRREKAKLIKDFNTCYTYKNRAWAENQQR